MSCYELRRIKIELMKQDDTCYYCGQKVYIYNKISNPLKPVNEATVEHLFMKFDPERNDPTIKIKYEISCWQCNHDIGVWRNRIYQESKKKNNSKNKKRKHNIDYMKESPMCLKWILSDCQSMYLY